MSRWGAMCIHTGDFLKLENIKAWDRCAQTLGHKILTHWDSNGNLNSYSLGQHSMNRKTSPSPTAQ